MKAFTELFENLDQTTSTLEKVAALKKYFTGREPGEAIWALLILTDRIKRKGLTSKRLRDLFSLATGYPDWLFEESHHHVGDTAETISLLLQSEGFVAQQAPPDEKLSHWMENEIPRLAKIKDLQEQAREMFAHWQRFTASEIFVLNKLMTGGFRVGVSEKLVVRALAEVFELPTDQVAHRLSGDWEPTAESFLRITAAGEWETPWSQPYPFCLAHSWLENKNPEFDPTVYAAEWKYDGIRSQVIKRQGHALLWSRGEERVTESFPDLQVWMEALPDGTVLDGEVVVIRDGEIADFNDLQKRLGRKKVTAATLKSEPAGLLLYDCLEWGGEDLRERSFKERRAVLESGMKPYLNDRFRVSPLVEVRDAAHLEELRRSAREHQAEGLMLKRWDSPYVVGRKTGVWWKYKMDPLTLDAVLIYAQAGSGRRANLYTDYTFALWREKELVPFAKAYSGLDDREIAELDSWIRRHTREKFGPVRSVNAELVFEIGFEGIAESGRHKSGVAVRFPRILRWRRDKKPDDADTLQSAFELIQATRAAGASSPETRA